MKRLLYVTLSTVVVAAFVSCTKSKAPDPGPDAAERESIADGVYTNEYFKLRLALPDGWAVADHESEQRLQEVGAELAFGGDETSQRLREASRQNTFQLLTVSQYEMGAPVDFNPNLILMAERVSHASGIRSGSDYLFHATKLLLRSQLPYELVKEPYAVELGGEAWHRADLRINAPDVPINQAYISTKRGDYVLIFILSAGNDDQMRTLEEIASSVEFFAAQ